MKERVPQAKAWDDPMVGVDFQRMGATQFSNSTDTEWMASQTLPLVGKSLSRARSAEAEARAVYGDVRRVRLGARFTQLWEAEQRSLPIAPAGPKP